MAKLRPVEMATETTPTITLEAAAYWRLKSRVAEYNGLQAQYRLQAADAQRALSEAKQAIEASLTLCGLDPNQSYQLDDAGMTATEVKPR